MNELGCATLAISPPTTPPSATPRFIVTRCTANAACRALGGVSPVSRLDWLGQNAPLPDAEQDVERERLPRRCRISGNSEIATAITSSAPISTRFGPSRSDERAGDEARGERGGRVDRGREPGEAERDPAHVVQVDDQERQDDPVPERVRQPADLQHPDRPRQAPGSGCGGSRAPKDRNERSRSNRSRIVCAASPPHQLR